jgi:WD40 repeat protein
VVRVCSADGRVRDIEVVDEMVRSLAFAADGKKLAWGSENAVGLLDLSTGRSLWRRTDKKWSGMRVALSPDGSLVFAARIEEREVLLLSAADGDTVRTIEAASDIHAIAVVPTLASRLVTVGDNLQVWDGPSGAEVRKPVYIGLGVPALGAGGGRFASGGMFGDVRVWEAGTGRELRSWSDAGARTVGDLDAVESIALSPDGKLVATGHRSGRIRVRVVATGKEILAPGSPPLESWLFVASPDGEWIASAGREGTPRVRVSSRDAEPRDFPGYAGALLAGPEGSWLATSILDPDRSGSRRTLLRIVQPRSGAKLRDVTQIDLFSPLLSLRGAIVGQLHEAAGREGRGAIRLFGARSVSDDRDLIQNPEGRLALVMPDASHIVTVADDAQLVWSTESSQVVARREGAYRRIEWHDHGNLTALIPQKGWVVSIRKDDAGTIHLWAFRTGRILRMLPGHRTRRVAVLPDGRTLVSSGDDCTMRLWDAETGTLLDKIATDGSPTCLAVQGRTIWAVFPGVIHRYDVAPAGD